ncbi:MAG: hypothetical protein WC445_02495 [Patescibacteria group bacterium]
MGKVVSIFADGRLHRQFLDRITRLDLEYMNGNLYLKLTTSGNELPGGLDEWLRKYARFLFVVNNGEKIFVGRSSGRTSFTGDPDNVRYVGIEFRGPKGGSVNLLKEHTLEITLAAGKEQKSFTAIKEGKKDTPEIEIIS